MGFVVAKCQKCGYNMNIDDSLEKGFCPACGTPYIRDQLPKTGDTIAERIKSAEVFFTKLGDKNKALEIFASVTNDAPDDYRGWWGIVRVRTDQFERLDMTTEEFGDIQKLAQNAYTIAQSFSSESVQFQIESIWNTYEKRYNLRVANDRASLNAHKDSNLEEISKFNEEISRLRSQVNDIRTTLNKIDEKYNEYNVKKQNIILNPKLEGMRILCLGSLPLASYPKVNETKALLFLCFFIVIVSIFLIPFIGAGSLIITLVAIIFSIILWNRIHTFVTESRERDRLNDDIYHLTQLKEQFQAMISNMESTISATERTIANMASDNSDIDRQYIAL